MTRLIDADALKYDIGEIDDGQYKRTELYVTNEAIAQQPTTDAIPLDGSFLKMSKGEYLIYNRHWLYEHFDMEMEIQRSAMKSMGYEPALKDAQPLIRCKDCKYGVYETYGEYGHYCCHDQYIETGEEFCAWAERKEDTDGNR